MSKAKKVTAGMITLGVISLLAIILLFSGCSSYNGLVNEELNVDQKWAAVEVQYQRRYDLIPRLVETVKGYSKHESETFQKVTDARAGLSQAYNEVKAIQNPNGGGRPQEENTLQTEEGFQRYTDAQARLSKAYGLYINAVHEAYPDLKADKQFLDLQTQLEGTENRIAFCRDEYTTAVKEYNGKVRRFPGNIWAGIFGFDKKPQYRADEMAASAPEVSF